MNSEGLGAEGAGMEGAAPNLIQRVMMAFGSPTKLGEALAQRSPWVLTLTIVAVVGALMVLITPAELLQQAAEAQAGPRPPEGQEMPGTGVMRGIGIGSALIGTFVFAAIVAGVLYLVFNVFFGQSEISFKQHLSALSHAWWILLLGNLLTFALQVAKGDATLRLGFGLLLTDEPSSFLGYFLSGVTLFGLWSSVALGATESGLTRGKLTPGKGITTVVVLYLATGAVMALLQGLRG